MKSYLIYNKCKIVLKSKKNNVNAFICDKIKIVGGYL